MTEAVHPALKVVAHAMRGEAIAWNTIALSPSTFLDCCTDQGAGPLIYSTWRAARGGNPAAVFSALETAARRETATELVRRAELVSVLGALDTAGVQPILIKGAALAYQSYDEPAFRPRTDTDLVIAADSAAEATRVFMRLGYRPTLLCDGEFLFGQFEMSKTDALGLDHAFDVHVKISTQIVFGHVLDHEELKRDSVPVPQLGPGARAAGPVQALLLACIHPVMHHRGETRLLWIYDVHLLMQSLSAAQLDRFAQLAVQRGVAAVCADAVRRAQEYFHTPVSPSILSQLTSTATEATVAYLRRNRRWHHEAIASIRGLPRWRDRLQLAREVLLPSRQYMLAAYGIQPFTGRTALLPVLYAHRALHGVWKIVAGRK